MRSAWGIEAIESAAFLTEEQQRDIFYDNAARFLQLSEEEFALHRPANRQEVATASLQFHSVGAGVGS